jgi:branched-chain amino acid transport system permease protein
MTEVFGIPVAVILGQLMLGLVNGSYYAMLSLGLSVIFGLMGIVNFAHGAFYALGAFAALLMLQYWGVNYWFALLLSPLFIGAIGIVIERLLLRHLYKLDPLYGLLLTFGLALMVQGLLHQLIGASGQTYPVPSALSGAFNLGFMILPIYRAWVILVSVVICFATWYVIERTRLGATLRAARENALLLQAFGMNVPLLVMATFGAGVALAALAGVLSAPIILVNSEMGSSLLGSIVSGLILGMVEGLTKVLYPEASNVIVFVIMALVLILRPAGLFGRE